MQRILDVTRWVKLEQGSRYEFSSAKPRRIRLDVNSPGDTLLYYMKQSPPSAIKECGPCAKYSTTSRPVTRARKMTSPSASM